MKDNYNNAKVCQYRGDSIDIMSHVQTANTKKNSNYVTSYTGYCDLKLDPDLIR